MEPETSVPMQSETISEIAKAVCNMQQTDLFALTDSKNPFFNSKYADLSSVWMAVRKPLTDNGLAVIQTTEPFDDGVIVVTTLMHTSGEWIKGKLAGKIVPDKKGNCTPQGLLALITYLRRAALSAIVGVCPEDDDGETVMGRRGTTNSTPDKLATPKPLSTTPIPTPESPPAAVDNTPESQPAAVDDTPAEPAPSEHEKIPYTLPHENDSEAVKHLKTYAPNVTVRNADDTHFLVGKFNVEISEDGAMIWSDVPKFGATDFDMDGCVPCVVAGIARKRGIKWVASKYGIAVTPYKGE